MSEDIIEHTVSDGEGDGPSPTIAEVTVKGPGISITRPVDEATMSGIIGLLFGAAPAAPVARGGGASGGGQITPTSGQQSSKWRADLTLGEFIDLTGPTTFPHKICAAGYYLMKLQGRQSFSRDDVRTALVNAHEDMPSNFARDWNAAASSNLIAQKPGESGLFIVPRTGRTAVDSHFQDLPKRRARRATKKSSAGIGE